MPVTKSSPKRHTQRQLTKIFCIQAEIPIAKISEMQRSWWTNPTDSNSLRLSLTGLQFVKANLKLQGYEFPLNDELTNFHILQLERLFQGMYYLLRRQKIILFEEEEAVMMALYGNDLKTYLTHLELTQQSS